MKKDEEIAYEYFTKGVQMKCPLSMCFIGKLYLTGNRGKTDLDLALMYFMMAHEAGHPSAEENINLVLMIKAIQDMKVSTPKKGSSKDKGKKQSK